MSLGFTIYDYILEKLSQLKTELTNQIQNSIQAATNQAKTEKTAEMIKFRYEQIKGRVGRKLFTIPKTNYKWITVLRASETGVTNLQDVVIMNVYINR